MKITDDDKLYKGVIAKYSKKISDVTNEITREFGQTLLGAKSSPSYWRARLKVMKKLFDKLANVQTEMIKAELPLVYKNQLLALNDYTRNVLKVKLQKQRKKVIALAKDKESRAMLESINNNVTALYTTSSTNGYNEIQKIYRATQQRILSDKAVAQRVAAARTLGDIDLATESLKNSFDAVLKGQVIRVNGRRYKPEAYSRLVARTQFHELQTFATKKTARNYDFDLVRVSSHNTTTVICQQYEGKVYSTGGKVPGYPILDAAPPFHPNCLHNLFPESIESLRAQGIAEQTKQFSQGKIDKPPIPKNFIPVDKRPKLSVKQELAVKRQLAKFEKMSDLRVRKLKDLKQNTKAYKQTKQEIDALHRKIVNRRAKLKTEGGWDKLL